jgi:cell division protein FtsZ
MSRVISDELTNFDNRAVIKVCGIGGGGGNAVGRMIEAGMEEVDFITINTDAQALRHSAAGTRLQIGENGLGAGAKPDIARQAAEMDRERLSEVLKGADMIFLTAGLGGGTGTGATPIVAEVARETGALTVAIVTLPFRFEGGGRMENAQKGLAGLQNQVDALIVVPNDRLALLCQENVSFLNAFRLADEVLHNGVRAISELITVPGLINLDFADVRTIMQGSGRALMGIGNSEGDGAATRAAEEAIVCPLLEKSGIEGAMGVVVNVRGGSNLAMKEVLDAVTTVQKRAHPQANIIFGAVVEEQERPDVQITVIAAGFAAEQAEPVREEEQEILMAVPDEMMIEPSPVRTPAASVMFDDPQEPAAPPVRLAELEPVMESFMDPIPEPQQPEMPFMSFPETAARHDPEPYVPARNRSDEDLSIPTFMRNRKKKDRED